ncbi:cupin domain-containing protein [Pseudomonas aeruginosa]|uniref:cupin domain-containing protein n=1 Tax=Pseudomonas aeruginosa TaxID=287 RepID=UPI000F53FC7E|nr:cupin domain-containing protein [Pseudomonas aeruginosa]MBV5868520.1 cupin domain-containing protein [Pseudomonas aeruginosa]RPZ96305.1 cupin [Pseudomonas aeruginosa]RQB97622.1 cupin [Pseudomonas aeruginosa]HEK2395757.1 cupin domain-containing protein [Pseudomonas aeruginosa]
MSTSTTQAINFAAKLALFDDRWQPRVIAQMNDYQFKLVKIEGDFVWHSHADTDETFIVLAGRLRIDFRDGAMHLGPGEMYVVPRGVEHKPFAEGEVRMLLVEPCGVRNTGDQGGEWTAVNDLWI